MLCEAQAVLIQAFLIRFGTDFAGMKRQQTDLLDASDRAHKMRRMGLVRIPLEQLGFWPQNRGGVGVISNHVHEVAHDIRTNTTKARRYSKVDIVKVPENCLAQVREANRELCDKDPLMPRFSEMMAFVTVSKTHFVHAQKLAKDGHRCLWNDMKEPIKWLETDTEGHEILEHGPVCQIFEEELFEDKDAFIALASEDNMNAGIQLGEDEMQGFGRVHQIVTLMGVDKVNVPSVLEKIRVGGMGSFSDSDWLDMIKLRAHLPKAHAELLQTCHFQASAGRVRVKACDFGLAARLDPRTPWSKVALMLFQYIGNLPTQSDAVAQTFNGRKDIHARKLSETQVTEIVAEPVWVMSVEVYIVEVLTHYGTPTGKGKHGLPDSDLLSVRGKFLANTGRLLMKIGAVIDNANRKEKLQGKLLSPGRRAQVLDEESKGTFSKLEDWFRKELVKVELFAEADLPAVVHPIKAPPDSGQVAPSQGTLLAVAPSQGTVLAVKAELSSGGLPLAEATSSSDIITEAGILMTEQHVYDRLGVKGCGENVHLSMDDDSGLCNSLKNEANGASKDDTVGVVDVDPNIKQGKDKSSWSTVRLVSVSLPNAVVEVRPGDAGSVQTVLVDRLRAIAKVKDQKPIILHPVLLEPGRFLPAYDYASHVQEDLRSVAQHMLTLANVSAVTSVEGLTVSRLSEDDKPILILQVRAKQAFKKGTLFLPPACGQILSENDPVACGKSGLHSSMLTSVELRATLDFRLPKSQSKDGRTAIMSLYSPLHCAKNSKAREEVLDNLPPFWAVLRCGSPKTKPNMELLTPVLVDGAFDNKSACTTSSMLFPKFPKQLQYSVSLPILRNSCNIAEGEVLCLPIVDAIHE